MAYFPEKRQSAYFEVLGTWSLYERVVRDPENLGEFFMHKKILAAGKERVKAKGIPAHILLGQKKCHVVRSVLERFELELNLKGKDTIIVGIKFNYRINGFERDALCDAAQMLIKSPTTFAFYPNQTSWVFITNTRWKKGAHAALNELFELNTSKGTTSILFKAFRRISSILLSNTTSVIGLERFRGVLITKDDLIKYYRGDMTKVEAMISATDGFCPISPNMAQAMVGRKLYRNLMGGKTWRMLIKRDLPRPLHKWETKPVHGYIKGNMKVLQQLEKSSIDYVIYEWNIVDDILPKWELEMAKFSTIIHSTRTRFDWQTVMNGGIWGLYAYAVRRRGESVHDIIEEGAESIRKEYKIQCEAYDDDALEDLEIFDPNDEDYESYGDIMSAFKKLEDPLEFQEVRSQVVDMLFNGPAYKYKAQNFSVAIPDNWAKLVYSCPDLTGFNKFGVINFENCQLKSGQIHYAGKTGPAILVRRPNASANEWIGIHPDQPVEMVACCDYYEDDDTAVYFNIFDLKVMMPQAGGFDWDDPFIVWFNKHVVARMKKNVWFPPKSSMDEEFKAQFMRTPLPDSTRNHNWEEFGLEILEKFRSNTLPGIGLYSYCLGCMHLLVRYGEYMLQNGTSFKRMALPWNDKVKKEYPNPEDRWEYFDIAKDWKVIGNRLDGKPIWKSVKEIITHVLKNKEIFLWALEHIEAVIDAANGKPKYAKDPNHPGHYLPSLDAYELVRYLSEDLFRKFPGPDGKFINAGIRVHTPMDIAITGVSGCEYKRSDGKKLNEPMMFGAREEHVGSVIPAVLTRRGGFISKKEEALKSTDLIWHKHISGGANYDFIHGEFTEFMKKVDSENTWDDFFEAYWTEVYGNSDFQRWENSEPWHFGYIGTHDQNWLCKLLDADRTDGWTPEDKMEEFIRVAVVEGAFHIEKRMKQYALVNLYRNRTPRRKLLVKPSKRMLNSVHRLLLKWFITNCKDTVLRKKGDDKFHTKATFNEYVELKKILDAKNQTFESIYTPYEKLGWMGNLVWYDSDGNRKLIEITKHFLAWLIKKDRQSTTE